VTYLFTESGADVAAKFIAAIAAALGRVGRHPRRGTLRFSFELDIPGLRAWPLTRFPCLVFYVERDSEIDVWRRGPNWAELSHSAIWAGFFATPGTIPAQIASWHGPVVRGTRSAVAVRRGVPRSVGYGVGVDRWAMRMLLPNGSRSPKSIP
jgi:plasmid stabilization system protein ParE